MKKQTQFQGSNTYISRFLRKTISLFLLLLLPVIAINALPQSFFISPGQVIEDGKIIRGYCLEYNKDMLNDENIGELKKITGNVLVSFRDGTTRVMTFEDLYLKEKMIQISGYGSAQYVRINLDSSIASVTVSGIEGIVLEEQTHSGGSEEVKQRRSEILEQIQSLPTVMADVVKWPHHAHIFKNIGFVEQFNRIVNPSRIIYQAHNAQDEKEFEAFIWRTSFPEKFINSAKHRVDIISLLEWLIATGRLS